MRIEAAALARAEIAFRRPFVIASGAMTHAVSVLVALRAEEGTVGYGETTCQTSYTGAIEEGLTAALERYLLPAVIGLSPLAIQAVHAAMDRALRGNELAKAAVDLACFDLAGKRLGVPVHELLGGKVRESVPLGWSVGLGSRDEMAAEARQWAERGLAVKVKIGGDPATDLANVRAVREAVGPEAVLRVDANARYSVADAMRILPRMEESRLQCIEQPVAAHDLAGLARLRNSLATPILADESYHSPHDALRLIDAGAADAINLKVVKPGGLLPSRLAAAVAQTGGLQAMIGSMPEMGLATAAGLHLALACPIATYPAELIGPLMLVDDILTEPLPGRRGELCAPDGPGFGVALRDDLAWRWVQ